MPLSPGRREPQQDAGERACEAELAANDQQHHAENAKGDAPLSNQPRGVGGAQPTKLFDRGKDQKEPSKPASKAGMARILSSRTTKPLFSPPRSYREGPGPSPLPVRHEDEPAVGLSEPKRNRRASGARRSPTGLLSTPISSPRICSSKGRACASWRANASSAARPPAA